MSVLRSASYTPLHPGSHWASRRLSVEINRGHVLGLLLVLVLIPLLFNLLAPPAPAVTPSIQPASQRSGPSATQKARRMGFRGVPVTQNLSLEDAATNHEYYRIMTSVCHSHGQDRGSTAYAYLFHANNRYSLSGHWSNRMFDMAVDSIKGYFDIDPVADCRQGATAFRGLDLNADLQLKMTAYNHVFFNRKIGICRASGNEVQARSYIYLAETELDKAYNGRRSREAVRAAIREAEEASEMQRIYSC